MSTPTQKRPTPITDAAETDMSENGVTIHTKYVRADICRDLERQLAERTEQRDGLATLLETALDYVQDSGDDDTCKRIIAALAAVKGDKQ